MESVSRNFLIFLILLASSDKLCSNPNKLPVISVVATELIVYEENGKVGVKNGKGEVLIPAQYDGMGWSNGEFSIVNNVTGYRSGNLWGLINLQNNKITKAEFVDLSPGHGELIVARKKISGTVKIQTGCINTSGKEVIPFQYDGMKISSLRAIVYLRNGAQFKHGLIDFENKVLIPLKYANIYSLGSLRYGVENFDNKTAIFSEDGKQITDFVIDSLSSFKKDYAIIYQGGFQGLIDRQGEIRLPAAYSEILITGEGAVKVKKPDSWLWLNTENKIQKQTSADRIEVIGSDRIRITNGRRVQLTDAGLKSITQESFTFIGPFEKGKAVVIRDNKMGVINAEGKIIVKPLYKQVIVDHPFVRANQPVNGKDRWIVLDSTGASVSAKAYDYVGPFNGKYFPAKHYGYWGAVNEKGKEVIACVHDSLVQQLDEFLVVEFKGSYGIINFHEDWIITPQQHPLRLLSNTHYFELAPKTTFLKSLKKEIIYFSDNKLEAKHDHLIEYHPDGAIWKINYSGVIIDRGKQPENSEIVFAESEGLRGIKKDGRYGFVDDRGRLRIANRYEAIKPFSGTLAAVKILGRWGFINHQDNIAVQPVYDDVSPFINGVAVVKQKDLFGMIDKTGKLLFPVRYDNILVLNEKLVKLRQNGLWGLADIQGKMIINAKFDELIPLDNGNIIVSREGKWGLINQQGVSTVPMVYDHLSFDSYHNQYIAHQKTQWEEVKL